MTRRTRVLIGAGIAIVAAGVATAAAIGIDLGSKSPAATSTLPPATAKVARQTLTDTEKVNGTLGYGDTHAIVGHTAGVVTWLPAAGSQVTRGAPVYRVNDKPVPLLYGTLPPYRALRSGVSGTDVKQFEENLAALGYTGFTVDEDYTSATTDAVEKWQKDLGLDQTGTVEIGQVVVAPVAIRVAALTASVGDSAVAPLLTYTATTRVVDVDLDVSKQTLVKPGLAATVTLPDNSTVDGKIDSVGSVATTKNGAGGQPGTATIAVVVSIADQSKLGTLDAAPVTVSIVSDRRENVLTVPVAALVALSEGGYGVQVVQGNDAFYVAVHTGLFANGRVEITGDGITDGTVVGMPK